MLLLHPVDAGIVVHQLLLALALTITITGLSETVASETYGKHSSSDFYDNDWGWFF
jgi:hypothetical protein